jgi:uncharacterized protein (TIGR00255 family)
MALMSMTGFGASTFAVGPLSFRIEAKSVNHKALVCRVHLPPELHFAEGAANALVRQRLLRGSVEVKVELEQDLSAVDVVVNRPALTALMHELQRVATEIGAPSPSLELALRQGNLVTLKRQSPDLETLEEAFTAGLTRALDALVHMREVEGLALARDIEGRLAGLDAMLADVEIEGPRVTAALMERLKTKVSKLESELGMTLDQGRILSELVVFSDKSDVTEEVVRARAHLAQFRKTLMPEGEQERGRRLDFLTQELLREFNTLGSKCRDAGVVSAIVDAKVELEKIREQSQNIA